MTAWWRYLSPSLFALRALFPALAALLAAALILAAPSSMSARAPGQFVVMDAVGVRATPGQELDLTRPLTLKAGEKLSLIGHNGFIMHFAGPATVTAAQVANPYGGKFFDPLRSLLEKLEKSGALRSAKAGGRVLENPWYVDVTRPGSRCVLDKAPVTVWRDVVGLPQTLVMRPADGRWSASSDWPPNRDVMTLGGDLRFDNGERVVAELEGTANELNVFVIPLSVTTPAAQAAWMIEKGCEDQAVVIVRGLIGN